MILSSPKSFADGAFLLNGTWINEEIVWEIFKSNFYLYYLLLKPKYWIVQQYSTMKIFTSDLTDLTKAANSQFVQPKTLSIYHHLILELYLHNFHLWDFCMQSKIDFKVFLKLIRGIFVLLFIFILNLSIFLFIFQQFPSSVWIHSSWDF